MNTMTLIYATLGLLLVLLVSPTVAFLLGGWDRRRRNIVETLSESAIRSYFKAFHPNSECQETDVRKRFEGYYRSEFGRDRFIWPLLLMALIAGVILYWSAPSIFDLLQYESVDSGKLPFLASVAFMGAYMWVLFDQITKWYSSDLSPGHIYWWCFRFVICIPMGYAVKDVFAESFAPAVVFFLGALPTSQVMRMARRIANQRLGMANAKENAVSELQSLQGIDAAHAEQFEAEGVTSILKLAYFDPIRLTIRTGFNYSYIVDCACQALLWIYVEQDIAMLRKSGLRSAYEVAFLWYQRKNPAEKQEADALINEVANALQRTPRAVSNILEQVAIDPFTQFLFLSWTDCTEEQLERGTAEVFGAMGAPA